MKQIKNKERNKAGINLIVFFLYNLIIGTLFVYISEKMGFQALTGYLISNILLLLLLIYINRAFLKKDLSETKNKKFELFRLYFPYYLIATILSMGCNIIFSFFKTAPGINQQSIIELMKNNGVITLMLIIVCAPIIEELVFRKSMRDLIKNDRYFLIFSSLFFALLHLKGELFSATIPIAQTVMTFIPYFIMGYALGLIYLKSKNIYASIFFHMLNNAVAALLIFLLV